MSCCTGCCSSPPWCNGRYLLLSCSRHTITELCGCNLCLFYVSPLHSSLLSLLALSVVSASMLQCLFCHLHTQIHSHTLLSSSSRFLIFLERGRMSSEALESPCMAACINICTLIWPCLSSSIHPDIDWFSQQVSVPRI